MERTSTTRTGPGELSLQPHHALLSDRSFKGFEKSLFCSPRLHLFDQKYSIASLYVRIASLFLRIVSLFLFLRVYFFFCEFISQNCEFISQNCVYFSEL